jgi:hypothetical protein
MLTSSTAIEPRLRKKTTRTVAEEDDEDGEADGRLRRRDGEHQQREDLTDEIAEMGREGDEIDVHRQEDQFHRHQDDDDVLAVEEDAEHAEREQDRRDREIMRKADGHDQIPCPDLTLTTSMAVAGVRADWAAGFCRLTPTLWRSVSTMAPIIATSRTRPESWKKNRYFV